MKSPPPRSEKRAERVDSQGAEPKFNIDRQESVNYHAAVPPEDRDGFEIAISGRGYVVLKQHRPCADEVVIVLHPDEARALLKLLRTAIEAADAQQKGAP